MFTGIGRFFPRFMGIAMIASMGLVAATALAAPAPSRTYAAVPTAKDACIRWTYAENRMDSIHSAPNITFTNKCKRDVRAYICSSTVYSASAQPCIPNSGSYWNRIFPPISTHVISTSSGGGQVVIIRECPAGYERPVAGNVSDFPCDKK